MAALNGGAVLGGGGALQVANGEDRFPNFYETKKR